MTRRLIGGAAQVDITPEQPQFLFGYPHVPRVSSGVHDPLRSAALYLCDGRTPLLWVASDVIFVARSTATAARERIEKETGVPAANVMITATHTHSGPVTADVLGNARDPVVPAADPRYLARLEEGIVEAALCACRNADEVTAAVAMADSSSAGGNRHDPAGPSDPQVPVLLVRSVRTQSALAAMLVCNVHPTVLHEDSTLVSGDFPAMTRDWLRRQWLGDACVVLHHTGPAGDQSPRHVARASTFEEATRLGEALARSVAAALTHAREIREPRLECRRGFVRLPLRELPALPEAEAALVSARRRWEELKARAAPRGEVRTAECDWFGAEETLALAQAATDGRLAAVAERCMPAEVQLTRVGPWIFAGWPGECYAEFGLEVKRRRPDVFVISLAGGELQGYLVTEEAVRQRRYEALNAIFASPQSGQMLVAKTLELAEGLA